jgi:copper chaperone CopZ
MEFMLRAINELEKQLTTIESSVQKVKLKIDEQNNKIKQNVHTIKKKIIEKAIIVEESGFKKENNP